MRPGRGASLLAGLIVLATVTLTVYAATRVDWHEVWTGLEQASIWWTLVSLAVFSAAIFVRMLRWQSLFARERQPPLAPVGRSLLICYFFNSVLPMRAGEPARIVALSREAPVSPAEVTATVVVERAFDIVALLLMLALAFHWLPPLGWNTAAAWVFSGAVLALLAALVGLALGDEPLLRRFLGPLQRLPGLGDRHVVAAARNLSLGLAVLRNPRAALTVAGWTILSWILLAISAWTLAIGFGLHLSPLSGLLVIAAVSLVAILPALPASLGVFEAAAVLALDAYGVSRAQAVSYAVVFHAINVVPFLVAGLPLVHRHADLRRARSWGQPEERVPAS
jgi:uncharacterized protein (TIRG00374 family)